MKAFEQQSELFVQDLCRKLQELCYNEKGNLCDHFDKLRTIQEELAVLGNDINEKDFANTIMSSLSTSYDSIGMIITTQAKFSGKALDPEEIMSVFTDEYDRHKTKTHKTGSLSQEDSAYSASSSNKRPFKWNCHKCGKKGHKAKDCPNGGEKSRRGGKQSRKGKGNGGKAAMATTKDDEPDSIWFVQMNKEDETGVCTTSFDHVMLANKAKDQSNHTVLFDSGATHHMLSSKDQSINFTPIPPKQITAVDKHVFKATA